MNFKNQDSLIEYNTLLENFKLKFNEILNLKMGMKIGKIIENDNKKEKDDNKDDVKDDVEDDKKDNNKDDVKDDKDDVKDNKDDVKNNKDDVKNNKDDVKNNKDDVKNNKKDDKKDDEKLNLFISGSYCTYENNVYQNISRWWNNENRGKTFTYLDKDFTKFVKFLDLVKYKKKFNYNDVEFIKLTKNINKLINKIIPGLYNLKQTYFKEKKMEAKIDSIILTLIDFKAEISKKEKKKTKFKNKQRYNEI